MPPSVKLLDPVVLGVVDPLAVVAFREAFAVLPVVIGARVDALLVGVTVLPTDEPVLGSLVVFAFLRLRFSKSRTLFEVDRFPEALVDVPCGNDRLALLVDELLSELPLSVLRERLVEAVVLLVGLIVEVFAFSVCSIVAPGSPVSATVVLSALILM
ncbi:hypothetical protein KS4_13580 [Poriferisphaera corsica]|uniref:Uncharacterized protein n=1 Tax=Poriferisphaera corsica TaxID=2528020 RepID=A0A517YT26_9BACT|nr:hypothetical protein [Poriferisphaera corsica]QDU33312.1 hypothetical protein KS4_13580 [Poriferisphaera corsica]